MRAENNKFTSMPYIPFKIVMALLENDNFCSYVLIHFITSFLFLLVYHILLFL